MNIMISIVTLSNNKISYQSMCLNEKSKNTYLLSLMHIVSVNFIR